MLKYNFYVNSRFLVFMLNSTFNFNVFAIFYSNSQKNRENGMKTRKSSKIRKNRENPKSLNLVRFHDFFANFLSQKITLIFHSVFFSNYCILAFIPFVFTIFCEPNLNSQKIVKTNGMKARVYCYDT